MLKVILFIIITLATSLGARSQGLFQLTNEVTFLINPATMSGVGSKIFYLRRAFNPSNPIRPGTLYLRRLDSSVPELLLEGVHMDWMLSDHTGSTLIFGVDSVNRRGDPDDGKTQIFSLDVETKRLVRLVNFRFQIPTSTVHVAIAENVRRLIIAPFGGGIWEILLEGGELKQVTSGNQGVNALATDPNAQQFYLADGSAQGGIWRVSRTGERQLLIDGVIAEKLFLASEGSSLFVAPQGLRYITTTQRVISFLTSAESRLEAVSANGLLLLVESSIDPFGENRDRSAELFLVSATGGFIRQLTRSDDRMGPVVWGLYRKSVKLSDDGSRAMVLAHSEPSGSWDPDQQLYRILTSTREVQLLEFTAEARNLFPHGLANSPHVIYLSEGNFVPGFQYILARGDGSNFRILSNLPATATGNWSPNGEALVSSRVGADSFIRLVVHRIKDSTSFEVPTTMRIISSGLPHDFPRSPLEGVSVDDRGETLVFSSSQKARTEDPDGVSPYLYLAQLGTSSLIRLKLLGSGRVPQISADGRVIVFETVREGRTRIVVMRSDTSGLREIGSGSLPQVSADGQWVVFLDGNKTIVLARTDGSTTKMFTPFASAEVNLSSTRISGDARLIAVSGGGPAGSFFASFDREGRQIARVNLPDSTPFIGWSLDGAGNAYFASSAPVLDNLDGSQEIFVARLQPFTFFIPDVPATPAALTGVAFTNPEDRPAELSISGRSTPEGTFFFPGVEGPLVKQLLPGRQIAHTLPELFGNVISGRRIDVHVRSTERINPFFLVVSNSVDRMDGSTATDRFSRDLVFPLGVLDRLNPEPPGEGIRFPSPAAGMLVSLVLFNPFQEAAPARIKFEHTGLPGSRDIIVPAVSSVSFDVGAHFLRGFVNAESPKGVLRVSAELPLHAELRLETSAEGFNSTVFFPGLEPLLASEEMIFPHVPAGGGFRPRVWIINLDEQAVEIELAFLDAEGRLHKTAQANPRRHLLGPQEVLDLAMKEWTGSDSLQVGYVRTRAASRDARIAGAVVVPGQNSLFSVSAARPLRRKVVVPYLVQNLDFFTGYTVVNPHDFPVRYTLEVFSAEGARQATHQVWIGAHGKRSSLISEILKRDQVGGYIVIEGDWPLSLLALIGTASGSALANVPPQ